MDSNRWSFNITATESQLSEKLGTPCSSIEQSYLFGDKHTDGSAPEKNTFMWEENNKSNNCKSHDTKKVFQDLFNILTNTNRDSQQIVTAENLLLHIVDILFSEECSKTEGSLPLQELNNTKEESNTDLLNESLERNGESDISLNLSCEFETNHSYSSEKSPKARTFKTQKESLMKNIVSLSDSNINVLKKFSNFTNLKSLKSELRSKQCEEVQDSNNSSKQINKKIFGVSLKRRTCPIQESKQRGSSQSPPEKQKLCREEKHSAQKIKKKSCPVSPLAIYSTPTRSKTTPIISINRVEPKVLNRCNSTGTLKSVTSLQRSETPGIKECKLVKKSSSEFISKFKLNSNNIKINENGQLPETSQGSKLSKISSKIRGLKTFSLVSRINSFS